MSDRDATDSQDSDAISAQERALFRDAIGPVQALPPEQRRQRPAKPCPSTRPRQTQAAPTAAVELADAPATDIDTGDSLSWRRNGVQLSVMRKLHRGHYRCQAELDLHGLVVATARRQLAQFLYTAKQRDYRCIRIIHGKGLSSGARGPVLKRHVAGWLRTCDDVLAYCSAPNHAGGTGAVQVLLRHG